MSLKSLLAVVLLLVTGVFGSVRCYLAADRLHACAPATPKECCSTPAACPDEFDGECDGDVVTEAPLQTHRSQHRQPLATRRREPTNAWVTPTPCDPNATATRRS